MSAVRRLVCVLGAAGFVFTGLFLTARAQPAPPEETAAHAQAILSRYCLRCHGGERTEKKLKVLDHQLLVTRENRSKHRIVLPGKPDESELIRRLEDKNDPMPPEGEDRPSAQEVKVLRDWIGQGAANFPEPPGPAAAAGTAGNSPLPAQVKEIFRTHCFECHGGSKTNAGVKILDQALLLAKNKVVPGKPDESLLFQLITAGDDSVMPPQGQPRLGPEDVETVRRWIAAGAGPFPADVAAPVEKDKDTPFKGVVGVDYVLKKILAHVRTLPVEDRQYVRYFSINHLLTGGATRAELDLQRDALAKVINHLSLEETIVRPESIDPPVNSVFAVDIRKLGWHRRPLTRIKNKQAAGPGTLNFFDLLDYPYGTVYEDSETYDHLAEEFLTPAAQVRPVVYVRSDWFVSVVTQPPLYDDFMQLPADLKDLETRLGVDSAANLNDDVAKRAGMSVSGVSRNNRVVERHPFRAGAYWKSFDYRDSVGQDNVFKDPVNLHPTAGEMIFNLPNGLQGYFVADGKGKRLEAAATEIVTDKFAEDKTVRNGLSCIRCHDAGMKTFADNMHGAMERLPGSAGFDKRQVLRLYPGQDEMDRYLKEDTDRFTAALQKALGHPQTREPVIPVSQRFLDAPLQLPAAAAELGLPDSGGLKELFRSPQFTGLGLIPLASEGVVRRDMWEDYYGQVVRTLGLGVPLLPLDGLTRRDFQPNPAVDVELTTNKKGNVFAPGDELVIFVTNKSNKDLYIELVGTSAGGQKVILPLETNVVKAGQKYRFPATGGLRIQAGLGQEQITLFASETAFPPGELLRGQGVADRVVHPFYDLRRDGKRLGLGFDPARMVKKTIDIETR
jgi:serine/threonine-protein kinase